MEALVFMLAIACYCDYRRRKIPNALLLVMFLYGFGQQIMEEGGGGIGFIVRCVSILLLLYPLFQIGAIGAGDVKLYGICGGYLPSEKFLFFFFVSLLIAAMISLLKMIYEGNMIERIRYLWDYLFSVLCTGKFRLYIENEWERKKASICLAGPILGSVLLGMGGVY